jgi:hypothetical protein
MNVMNVHEWRGRERWGEMVDVGSEILSKKGLIVLVLIVSM